MRRFTQLVVFLLLGAVVNVAVAWGYAWKVDELAGGPTRKFGNVAQVIGATPNQIWAVSRFERTGATRVVSFYFTPASTARYDGGDPGGSLPSWNRDYFFSGTLRDEVDVFRLQDGRGWPMLALWGQAVADSNRSSPPYCEVEYAILLTDFTDPTQVYFRFTGRPRAVSMIHRVRFLPLHPIWPGFAINTAFYAVIVWMLWSSLFVARRIVRHRRGHCIKCGYDLCGAEHEVCPECGVATGA